MAIAPRDRIIALASERGSTATTYAGALRYLRAAVKQIKTLPIPDRRGAYHDSWYVHSTLPYSLPAARLYLEQRHAQRLVARYGERVRLPRYLGAADRTILARHREQVLAQRRESDLQQAASALRYRAKQAYDSCGYRQARGRWAGGNHTVVIHCDDTPAVSAATTRAWSSNGKWSGLDSRHELWLSPTWLADVYQAGRAVVDGCLLLGVEQLASPPRLDERESADRAVWVVQGRGTEIHTASGVVYRGLDGVWHLTTEARLTRALTARQRQRADEAVLRPWRPEGHVEPPAPGSIEEWIAWCDRTPLPVPAYHGEKALEIE